MTNNGGRGQDRTGDPCDVNAVVSPQSRAIPRNLDQSFRVSFDLRSRQSGAKLGRKEVTMNTFAGLVMIIAVVAVIAAVSVQVAVDLHRKPKPEDSDLVIRPGETKTFTLGTIIMDGDSNGTLQFSGTDGHPDEWKSIQTAPRDGTIVELKNTYGIAPWYGIFRWTSKIKVTSQDQDGNQTVSEIDQGSPTWVSVDNPGSGVDDGDHLQWRPYSGNPDAYVDPTGGAQKTGEYWRRAAGTR
jgi:hypothetical protein